MTKYQGNGLWKTYSFAWQKIRLPTIVLHANKSWAAVTLRTPPGPKGSNGSGSAGCPALRRHETNSFVPSAILGDNQRIITDNKWTMHRQRGTSHGLKLPTLQATRPVTARLQHPSPSFNPPSPALCMNLPWKSSLSIDVNAGLTATSFPRFILSPLWLALLWLSLSLGVFGSGLLNP